MELPWSVEVVAALLDDHEVFVAAASTAGLSAEELEKIEKLRAQHFHGYAPAHGTDF